MSESLKQRVVLAHFIFSCAPYSRPCYEYNIGFVHHVCVCAHIDDYACVSFVGTLVN